MPLHPGVKNILSNLPPEAGLDVGHLPLEEALLRLRGTALQTARFPVPAIPKEDLIPTRDINIDGPHGQIPLRIYKPHNAVGVLVHFHGGGWVLGSIDGDEAYCQAIARKAGCTVVSVGYRLAPENRFPIPFDDCFCAMKWVAQAAGLLGDSDEIAIGGASAGANLAAAVALKARDSGMSPSVLQVLLYPVCDFNLFTASYQQFGKGYFLTQSAMAWFWEQYAGCSDRTNPYLAPLRATTLEGLPQTLLITAEYDPLRDEGEAFGQRLALAGVRVVASRYPGMVHGFITMGIAEEWGQQAIDECARALQLAFRSRRGRRSNKQRTKGLSRDNSNLSQATSDAWPTGATDSCDLSVAYDHCAAQHHDCRRPT